MNKKSLMTAAITIFLIFAAAICLKAQQFPDETVSSLTQSLFRLHDKIDALSGRLDKIEEIPARLDKIDKTNQDVLNKLNQVLSNQDKILQELDVIRIRASRGR